MRCFGPLKQNVSTPKFLSPIIALGSFGTLTFKFSPNFRLFIFPNIHGVSQNFIWLQLIDIPSTKSYTATQKCQFLYGKINTPKQQLFSNILVIEHIASANSFLTGYINSSATLFIFRKFFHIPSLAVSQQENIPEFLGVSTLSSPIYQCSYY